MHRIRNNSMIEMLFETIGAFAGIRQAVTRTPSGDVNAKRHTECDCNKLIRGPHDYETEQ